MLYSVVWTFDIQNLVIYNDFHFRSRRTVSGHNFLKDNDAVYVGLRH